MAVAFGGFNLQRILPHGFSLDNIDSLSSKNRLTLAGKVKLMAFDLFHTHKLSQTKIGTLFNVNKSTISRWVKQVKNVRIYESLNPKSRRPIHRFRQKRIINDNLKTLILEIRREYRCGHENIAFYLKRDYDIIISPSTIYRFLKKLDPGQDPNITEIHKIKNKENLSKIRILRIQQVMERLTKRAFERFQIDSKYWVRDNQTFYIITAIDVVTRMMFSYAYTTHSSNMARDFLRKLNKIFELKGSKAFIQRDNGREFAGKFEEECKRLDIEVITNYVRMPKMNGYIERLNRTIKEQLLDYNLVCGVHEVNELLLDYTIQYNFDRAHTSLDRLTPFEKASEVVFKNKYEYLFEYQLPSLQMYRTSTILTVFLIPY